MSEVKVQTIAAPEALTEDPGFVGVYLVIIRRKTQATTLVYLYLIGAPRIERIEGFLRSHPVEFGNDLVLVDTGERVATSEAMEKTKAWKGGGKATVPVLIRGPVLLEEVIKKVAPAISLMAGP